MWKGLIASLLLAVLALAGCKDLKGQQLNAYVGDSQTKIFYKNVGQFVNAVPKERRVFFRSMDDAMKDGYTLSNEAPDPNAPAPTEDSPAGY